MKIKDLYDCLSKNFRTITDTPELDARAIMCHVLECSYTHFLLDMDKQVSKENEDRILSMAQRRKDGEPVAYILGERGFYECTFKVTSDTLIPRADTEILVENAIEDIIKQNIDKKEIAILDLCCGTGCIGISVAKVLSRTFEKVNLTLADLSEGALSVCTDNAEKLLTESNISFSIKKSDLLDNIGQSFDAILTNPPYIATAVIPTLEKQVQKEPYMALDGGEDGLDLVRRIVKAAPRHLNKGGHMFMEIGYDQGQETKKLFEGSGFENVQVIKDYGDCDRLVKGLIKY